MTTKVKKIWLKQWKKGTWSSTSEGWVVSLDDTSIAYREMATRKHDIPPKPYRGWTAKQSKAHFYSRKYRQLSGFPLPYDPFKYVRPSSSVAHQEIIERDELFEDDEHFTWDADAKAHAELHLPGAVASLTTKQRQVFLMKYEKRMYMKDIAKELGIVRSAAHRRMQRAKERIREYLKKIPKKCSKM